MKFQPGTRVMCPFRTIVRAGDAERRHIFGNNQIRLAEVLPRCTGRIGPGTSDWLEEPKIAPCEDARGYYYCRCLAYGTVVIAHRSELVYVSEPLIRKNAKRVHARIGTF